MQMMTLSQKVQYLRNWAREVIRMRAINDIKDRIYELSKEVRCVDKTVKDAEHQLKLAQYDLSKLDEEHPDYDKQQEESQKRVEQAQKNVASRTQEAERARKDIADAISKFEQEIKDWEDGKNKVSIEDVSSLAESKLTELPFENVLPYETQPAEDIDASALTSKDV